MSQIHRFDKEEEERKQHLREMASKPAMICKIIAIFPEDTNGLDYALLFKSLPPSVIDCLAKNITECTFTCAKLDIKTATGTDGMECWFIIFVHVKEGKSFDKDETLNFDHNLFKPVQEKLSKDYLGMARMELKLKEEAATDDLLDDVYVPTWQDSPHLKCGTPNALPA